MKNRESNPIEIDNNRTLTLKRTDDLLEFIVNEECILALPNSAWPVVEIIQALMLVSGYGDHNFARPIICIEKDLKRASHVHGTTIELKRCAELLLSNLDEMTKWLHIDLLNAKTHASKILKDK